MLFLKCVWVAFCAFLGQVDDDLAKDAGVDLRHCHERGPLACTCCRRGT